MKTTRWFTCLPYGGFEVLISQDVVLRSSYASDDGRGRIAQDSSLREIVFDRITEKIFRTEFKKKPVTEIVVLLGRPVSITTGTVPRVDVISLDEFKVFEGKTGESLLNKGLLACRFTENKVQFLVDLDIIFKTGLADD